MISRFKPIVARTPKALAEALDLTASDAKEWQVRYELLKRLGNVAGSGDGDPE